MRRAGLAVFVIGAALFLSAQAGVVEREGEADVVLHENGDPVLEGAIASARQTLPLFWEEFQARPGEPDFMLKVRVPLKDGGAEHIWVDALQRNGAKLTGAFANEPLDIPDAAYGDPVSFTEDQISDWGYMRDGLLVGRYTTRVLLGDLSKEEADAIRAMLGEAP